MRYFFGFAIIFLALNVEAMPPGGAQDVENLGRDPIIGGTRVSCFGATTYVSHIQDIAYSTPGVIRLRPDFFQQPPIVQLYIYAHECAHQLPAIRSDEAAADCWAIQTGQSQGWLNRPGLGVIRSFTLPSPGDWTHMPGWRRAALMDGCYNQRARD